MYYNSRGYVITRTEKPISFVSFGGRRRRRLFSRLVHPVRRTCRRHYKSPRQSGHDVYIYIHRVRTSSVRNPIDDRVPSGEEKKNRTTKYTSLIRRKKKLLTTGRIRVLGGRVGCARCAFKIHNFPTTTRFGRTRNDVRTEIRRPVFTCKNLRVCVGVRVKWRSRFWPRPHGQ